MPTLGDAFMQVHDGAWAPKSHYGMEGERGMSLRDWFAGQALCGIIAAPGMQPDDSNRGGCATLAYEFADAMLTARKGVSQLQQPVEVSDG